MAEEAQPKDSSENSQRLDRLLGNFDFSLQLANQERAHHARTQALLLSFVEVLDSFHRLFAVLDKPDGNETEAAIDLATVRLIAQQLELALERAGVRPIFCVGDRPQPGRHQIADVRKLPEAGPAVIVAEILRGYEWDGEILRKSVVAVARNHDQVPVEE
jgi:molecular chaperone GrpE (heat shock protein)